MQFDEAKDIVKKFSANGDNVLEGLLKMMEMTEDYVGGLGGIHPLLVYERKAMNIVWERLKEVGII